MLKTVIVEDDRMVAAINAQFAEKTPGVQVVAPFTTGGMRWRFWSRPAWIYCCWICICRRCPAWNC